MWSTGTISESAAQGMRVGQSGERWCRLTTRYAIDGTQLSNTEPCRVSERSQEGQVPKYVVTTTPTLCGLILA